MSSFCSSCNFITFSWVCTFRYAKAKQELLNSFPICLSQTAIPDWLYPYLSWIKKFERILSFLSKLTHLWGSAFTEKGGHFTPSDNLSFNFCNQKLSKWKHSTLTVCTDWNWLKWSGPFRDFGLWFSWPTLPPQVIQPHPETSTISSFNLRSQHFFEVIMLFDVWCLLFPSVSIPSKRHPTMRIGFATQQLQGNKDSIKGGSLLRLDLLQFVMKYWSFIGRRMLNIPSDWHIDGVLGF